MNQEPFFTPVMKSELAATVAMMPAVPVMYWSLTNGHLLLGMVAGVAGILAGKFARYHLLARSKIAR